MSRLWGWVWRTFGECGEPGGLFCDLEPYRCVAFRQCRRCGRVFRVA